VLDDRCVQPRQIYASTLTRRERRWTSRPVRSLRLAPLMMAGAVAALSVLAVFGPAVI
jgi:hypothetical protein